jgi:hypothetical protein
VHTQRWGRDFSIQRVPAGMPMIDSLVDAGLLRRSSLRPSGLKSSERRINAAIGGRRINAAIGEAMSKWLRAQRQYARTP